MRAGLFNRVVEFWDRFYENQHDPDSGLPLPTVALCLWNAVYLGRVVAALRAWGDEVPEEYLMHLSPLEWEHITFIGVCRWDLGGPEFAIGADGFLTLRRLSVEKVRLVPRRS